MERRQDDWMRQFERMSLNLPASSIQHQNLNLLIFGPGGHGKSSTANSILGSEEFTVSCDGESETTNFESKSAPYEDYKFKVIDSPPVPRKDPGNDRMVVKSCGSVLPKILKKCPKGVHAIPLVLKFGNRFDREDEFAMAMLKRMFGEQFVRDHCICVITHGDMFNNVMKRSTVRKTFNEWCREQKGVLASFFKDCSYRCVLFDNFTNDLRTKDDQRQQLMSMIIDTWPQTLSLVSITPQMRIKTDIHMLVETASSFDDYQKQLKFVVTYTGSFNINEKAVRVSVMIFGESDHIRFDFNQLANQDQLAKAILGAPFLKPSSGTDQALMLARQESFCPGGGSRPEVKQTAIILTEGRSQDETKTAHEAALLKSSGAMLKVIAVASVDRHKLENIASDPKDVLMAEDYEELQDVAKEAVYDTCKDAAEFQSTADILFILDSSGSIGTVDYQKELNFVLYLTECFNIGPGAVHFSVMIFSNGAQLLFDFSFTTHTEIKEATLKAPYIGGGTDTAAALHLARTTAFAATSGTGEGKKIAVVITDGCSNDRRATAQAAQKLTDSGVLTLAIGVGDVNRSELEIIASLPEDVYMVDNYDVIQTINDEIAGRTSKLESVTNR